MGFGWQELVVILVIALLLFGGTRLAGIGKASGRAIREFKEETRSLRDEKSPTEVADASDATSKPTIVEQDPHSQA